MVTRLSIISNTRDVSYSMVLNAGRLPQMLVEEAHLQRLTAVEVLVPQILRRLLKAS